MTIQAQILRQLKRLRDETGPAVIMVTHDLGVVADIADRVVAMYGGRVVEEGSLEEIVYDPPAPVHVGAAGLDRTRGPRAPAPAPCDPRHPAVAAGPAGGLPLPPRCPHAFDKCTQVPGLEARVEQAPGHLDRCWLPVEDERKRRQVAGQIGLVAGESVIV